MTSNDLFIIEVFNNRMNTLEEKIISLQQEMKQNFDSVNKRIDNLQTEIKDIKQEIRVNSIKIEGVHNSVNWGFAGMTIAITSVIAIVGLIATLAPTVREYFASKQKKYTTPEEVENIVERAITNVLAGKLR